VDSGAPLARGDEERLEANLSLARKLGAETLVIEAQDIAEAVVETARNRRASMIVIGRSGLSRLGLLPRRPTVSDRIVREADPLDVAVVQDADAPLKDSATSRLKALFESPPREYALLLASFLFLTGLGLLLKPLIGYRSIALVYLAAVLGLSFLARPAPVALFAMLSALVLNFLFIAPQYTLRIATSEDLILFVTYFLVAFVTGSLVARLRAKERLLFERERRNAFLLSSTQRLAECDSVDEAARVAISIVREFYGAEAIVLVRKGDSLALAGADGEPGSLGLDPATDAAAARAFSERTISGRGTGIEPLAAFRCIPAATGERSAGVIAVASLKGKIWKKTDDSLLLSMGRTFAFVVERERAESLRMKADLELASERLSKVLLDSVSHELRTPLTTITGSMSALRDEALAADPEARKALVEGALDASGRLDRIVEDILSMSRIESGSLRLDASLVDLADLAKEAVLAAGRELDPARVRLELPEPALPVRLDFGLASRLVGNLLRNAARYSPSGSAIELSFAEEGGGLEIKVRDRGPGVAEEELPFLFERFRRGRSAPGGGLGLGLAICRGIALAHGGTIEAHNAPDGGLEVRVSFPGRVD
jgi:two-component system sensor histidine kinase KdpD